MNRRSLLRMLGLAPITAPVALALPAAPALPPVDYTDFTVDVRGRVAGLVQSDEFDLTRAPGFHLETLADGSTRFVIDARSFIVKR